MPGFKVRFPGIIKDFTSNTAFANVSTLMSGTIISAIVPILFAPILSRIFTPQQYGVIGLYISVFMIAGVLAYSHYSHAIMLAKDEQDSKQAVWFTITITTGASLTFFFIILVVFLFTRYIHQSAIGLWYFLIPLSVFLNGVMLTFSMWANKVQRYRTVANNRVIQAITTVVIQLSLGLLIQSETGLILGFVAGQLVSSILLVRSFCFQDQNNIGHPDKARFRQLAIDHKNLLLYTTPSDLINGLINQAPIFLLQKFGTLSAVGSYAFTQRFLGLPQMLVANSIADLFRQKASAAYNENGTCRSLFIKTFKALGAIGIIPFAILVIWAPDLVMLVFGREWEQAGIFTRYLAILYFCRFVISPLTYMYFIAGRLKEDLYLHVLFLLSTVAAFYIGDYFFNDVSMIILCYALSYSLLYILYLARSFKFSHS